jgi:hypothetical protein
MSTGTGTGTSFTDACGQSTTCTYEVRAFNAIGTSSPSNQSSATGLTDLATPTVTITSPVDNSSAQNSAPTISGTAGNDLGDDTTIFVTIKQGATPVRNLSTTRSGTSWSVVTSPALADGTYTVTAQQSDWASHTGTSSTITFIVDNGAPTVTLTGPHAGDVFASSGTVYTGEFAWATGCTVDTICGTASDAGSGVNNVKLSIRQGTGNYWNGSSFASGSEVLLTATGTTSWSLSFPSTNFPAGGEYTVRAVGTDNAANASSGTSAAFFIDYNPNAVVFVNATIAFVIARRP